jgi:hypothetical protein
MSAITVAKLTKKQLRIAQFMHLYPGNLSRSLELSLI